MGDPANLPDFETLAREVGHGTGVALQERESADSYLGKIHQLNGTRVHERAAQVLKQMTPKTTDLHRDLLRIYPTSGSARIVTTNFDLLFEQAAQQVFPALPDIFRAPALPLGNSFSGIVHIHGAISHPSDMVLTDTDFGRAYLTEGWARRFLVDLFLSFTVLFVGYSHDDIVMKYLAKALPASRIKRFALTDDGDDARWSPLNITPIVYPTSTASDHSALSVGVEGVANYARRGSREWKREITRISQRPPPSDQGDSDLIHAALSEPSMIRFFTSSATDPAWIDWLDNRGFLARLFGDDITQSQDRQLALWLADTFAIKYTDELFLLIARHNMLLHPELWFAITRAIDSDWGKSLETDVLSRWISLLLLTAPRPHNNHVLRNLAQLCSDAGLTNSLIDIFATMADIRFQIKEGFAWSANVESGLIPPVEIDLLHDGGDHYLLNEIWETALKPLLPAVAEPLLVRVIHRLESQHQTYKAWQLADVDSERTSNLRSAIEPDPQDEHPTAADVLVDAARDCLEELASTDPQHTQSWCDRLIRSEAPLLRRLAIHVLSLRTDLDSDGKAEWLLAHNGLHNLATHHETYRALRAIYPDLSPRQRLRIIEAVDIYRWPDQKDPEVQRHTAYVRFRWLHWLNQAHPDCVNTKEALDRVHQLYPDFQPSPHPAFLHWTGSVAVISPQSPWTVEELIAQSPRVQLQSLLVFHQADITEPSREGLLEAIEDAATLSFEWGYELADALAVSEHWETDIWPKLLRAWTEELDAEKHRLILKFLSRPELYPKHTKDTAHLLYALVKQDGSPYASELLPETNLLAKYLWHTIDHNERLLERDDWLAKSINHPAGILALYWVQSLSIWTRLQDGKSHLAGRDYNDQLTNIVNDSTIAGRLARTTLARNFSLLLSIDAQWVTEQFLILFERDDDIEDYQALWDGVTSGRLTPSAAELLSKALFKAMAHLDTAFSGDDRIHRFIGMYTAMQVHVTESPIEEWIPRFFKFANASVRGLFSFQLGRYLDGMDDDQQRHLWTRWLRTYWENRLYGVPAALSEEEFTAMLAWVPHFKGLLPEAVEMAIKMPKHETISGQEIGSIIFEIKQEKIWRSSPDAAARFLIYLKPYLFSYYSLSDIREVIIEIRNMKLESDNDYALEELYEELA